MSQDWRSRYESIKSSPAEALSLVQSVQRLSLGTAGAEPTRLTEALVLEKDRLQDVTIYASLCYTDGRLWAPEMAGHVRGAFFQLSRASLTAHREGRADFIPCNLSEIPRLFHQKILPVDVALVQLSPPDAEGYCSLGISVDWTMAALQASKTVIAEVNDQMPFTKGNCRVHVSRLARVVESSRPLLNVTFAGVQSEAERQIGELIAAMIPDGATIQTGIGGIPDSVLQNLGSRSDLGVHSGMFSDGYLPLVRSGVINGRRKKIDRGLMVATMAMGSEELYRFMGESPMVFMHPADYTHDIGVVSQLDDFISINSALQVDLLGQVNAETIGGVQQSGIGGQMDFIRAASASAGGKAIVAMPATAAGGKLSRIVPRLAEQDVVTTSRNDVHYVVTEFGVADLRGKTLRERAEALIGLAHPQFRDELRSWVKEH